LNALGSRLPGVFLLGLFVLCDVAWGRTWTTIEGRRSQGELVSFEDGQVTLLIDGREYTFPVSRFSAPDRAYLMKWKAEKRCGICRETVGDDKMQAGEQIYHPACFTCLVCERPFLTGNPSVATSGEGWSIQNIFDRFPDVEPVGVCSPKSSQA
jgi:hypothetical protein